MKLVIIEDEPLVVEALMDIIESLDEYIEVTHTLSSLQEADEFLQKNEPLPDLFLSDIQLTDGLSFEFFDKLDAYVPVVFCTAFDEYAIDAFKANGIDYILKPFDDNDIRNTIIKYQKLIQADQASEQAKLSLDSLILQLKSDAKTENLLIRKGQDIIPLSVTDIRLAYVRNGLVFLRTKSGEDYLSPHTMDKLSELLPNEIFRVNRQFLVHRDAISHASHRSGRKLQVHLKTQFEPAIIISKAKASVFLKWLERAE